MGIILSQAQGAKSGDWDPAKAATELQNQINAAMDAGDVSRVFFLIEVLNTLQRVAPLEGLRSGPAHDMFARTDVRTRYYQKLGLRPSGPTAPTRSLELDEEAQSDREFTDGYAQALTAAQASYLAALAGPIRRQQQNLRLMAPMNSPDIRELEEFYQSMTFPITLREAYYSFRDDEAAVMYFRAGRGVAALVLREGNATLTRLKVAPQDLEELVRKTRDSIIHRSPSWSTDATALAGAIIHPLESNLEGASSLLVIPTGTLYAAPLAALPDSKGKLLVERLAISSAPTVRFHVATLNRRYKHEPPRILTVGNPSHSAHPNTALPMAQREAEVVSRLYDHSRLFVGSSATETAVSQMIDKFNILHIAAHGKVFGKSALSMLLLADDSKSDGYWSVAEIAATNLSSCRLVVLSACNSAVSAPELGSLSPGEFSLSTAMITAGAGGVVGSLWPVEDMSTSRLMIEFYRNLDHHPPREALRMAQLAVRAEKRMADPMFWAAFNFTGAAQ